MPKDPLVKLQAQAALKPLSLSKSDTVVLFVLPGLRVAAQVLAAKDADEAGLDDEAANAIRYAVERIEKYLATKP